MTQVQAEDCVFVHDFMSTGHSSVRVERADELSTIELRDRTEIRFRWLHFPTNDTQRVKACLDALFCNGYEHSLNDHVRDTLKRAWTSKTRPAAALPRDIIPAHALHLEPSCDRHWQTSASVDPMKTLISCHLPYLAWQYWVEPDADESVLTNATTRHPRRTLDQFYYSGLQNTAERDVDQTVSKWTGDVRSKDGSSRATPGSIMVMADQMWFWVISNELLISFFPSHTSASNEIEMLEQHIEDITSCSEPQVRRNKIIEPGNVKRKAILGANLRNRAIDDPFRARLLNQYKDVYGSIEDDANFNKCSDAYELGALLAKQSITVIFEQDNKQSADLLGLYRWAIANKAARQTECLEDFRQRQTNVERGIPDDTVELNLILDTADILDELNMLSLLMDNQKEVLASMERTFEHVKPQKADQPSSKLNVQSKGKSKVYINTDDTSEIDVNTKGRAKSFVRLDRSDNIAGTVEGLAGSMIDEANHQLDRNATEVLRLKRDAEHVHKMLLDLLDLKSKEASLHEARAAVKQGQVVMLFTVVTIVFLPLSFFTSYFGQNVLELTGSDSNPTSAELWRIGAPISVVVIVIALLVAYMIYRKAQPRTVHNDVENGNDWRQRLLQRTARNGRD